MFANAEDTAKRFGITVEKLERMSKRKSCPKGFVDSDGLYDHDKVRKLLDLMEKQRAGAHKSHAARRGKTTEQAAEKKPKRKARNEPRHQTSTQETFEEFAMRFWETDEMWKEFVSAEANEAYLRYFVNSALQFGYNSLQGR